MNNYMNMNYIPNDSYFKNTTSPKDMMMPNNNSINTNNMMNNQTLKQKLAMQAGNNMNFNVADYNQSLNPNNLYDFYAGFIRGNMFPDLYNQYKIERPYEIDPLNEQAELLTYVDAFSFAAHDLNLYLDNNPTDRDMIQQFNKFTAEANKYIMEYEKKYGPLFVDASNTYPWAWNESPWPWENK